MCEELVTRFVEYVKAEQADTTAERAMMLVIGGADGQLMGDRVPGDEPVALRHQGGSGPSWRPHGRRRRARLRFLALVRCMAARSRFAAVRSATAACAPL